MTNSPFWRAGYRGVMVTDTAFYRHPQYRSALDTTEKLRYLEMARAVEGLARTPEAPAGAA